MNPASQKPKPLGRLTSWLALCLALVFLAACGGQEPSSSAALELKERVQAQIKQLAPALREPLQKRDAEAVRQILIDIGQQWKAKGLQEDFAVAVLDNKGVLVSSRRYLPSVAGERPPKRAPTRLNLGRFKVVARVLKSKKPAQAVLFLPPGSEWGNKVYVVMAPVVNGPDLVGVLARFILQSTLQKEGISEEEFLALSFK